MTLPNEHSAPSPPEVPSRPLEVPDLPPVTDAEVEMVLRASDVVAAELRRRRGPPVV